MPPRSRSGGRVRPRRRPWRGRVPDASVVRAGRGELAAIRTTGQADDGAGVASEREHILPGGEIPELDRAVVARGHDAILTEERDGIDRSAVAVTASRPPRRRSRPRCSQNRRCAPPPGARRPAKTPCPCRTSRSAGAARLRRARISRPVESSQSRTVLSSPCDARSLPSGLNASASTAAVWPTSVASPRPSDGSQSRMSKSSPAEAECQAVRRERDALDGGAVPR